MTATGYLAALGKNLTSVLADGSLDDAMDDATRQLIRVYERHAVVHLIGNGGSASVVAHAQNDLVKACSIRALVYQDIPLLTAYANDHGYARGYADSLLRWMKPDDLLVAVSSSGQSENIRNAVKAAKSLGCVVLTCSGFFPDNPLRSLGNINVYVPSMNYGFVELTHAALLHCLTDRLATHAG